MMVDFCFSVGGGDQDGVVRLVIVMLVVWSLSQCVYVCVSLSLSLPFQKGSLNKTNKNQNNKNKN